MWLFGIPSCSWGSRHLMLVVSWVMWRDGEGQVSVRKEASRIKISKEHQTLVAANNCRKRRALLGKLLKKRIHNRLILRIFAQIRLYCYFELLHASVIHFTKHVTRENNSNPTYLSLETCNEGQSAMFNENIISLSGGPTNRMDSVLAKRRTQDVKSQAYTASGEKQHFA